MPDPVLTCDDALHSLNDSPMVSWSERGCGSFGMGRSNVGEQVAGVLLADNFQISQGKKQRFTDAKGSHAVGFVKAYMFGHLIFLSDANLSHRPDAALIHIGQSMVPMPHLTSVINLFACPSARR